MAGRKESIVGVYIFFLFLLAEKAQPPPSNSCFKPQISNPQSAEFHILASSNRLSHRLAFEN
jgi:hypothetical protein